MIHKLHFPQPPLSQFVENMWLVEGFEAGYTREKILPDGAIELIIDLDTQPKSIFEDEASDRFRTVKKAWISGERTRYIVIGADANQSMVGIRFRPGGAYPFFRFPISELSESVTELDLIWGRLVDKFATSCWRSNHQRRGCCGLSRSCCVRCSAHWSPIGLFRLQCINCSTRHSFLPYATWPPESASHRNISSRNFEKVVGLRPKSFARVCKFQKVVNLIEQQNQVEWTSIAYECGYYDQAHFIKEFQTFSGLNPSAYLTQRGDYLNYIPIA